jgi:hypothetical protein
VRGQDAPGVQVIPQWEAQSLKVARRRRVAALRLKSPVGGIVATLPQQELGQVPQNTALYSTKETGTALGLSLCREIVAAQRRRRGRDALADGR